MNNEDYIRVGLKGQKNESISGDWCSYEIGEEIDQLIELYDVASYPPEQQPLIEEFNQRAIAANERYYLCRHCEDTLINGFEAGMYICTFDHDENMLSFVFTDGTRRMLGYDGLDDLPNEFDSWVKTLLPEERDTIVPIFWSTVRHHRELPEISHAEYRMLRKDGKIIWVTGAGKFVRRDDGSLAIYMGCYRDVTADHEKSENLRIIRGVGRIFNFSLYINIPDATYRIISTNEFVNAAKTDDNAFTFMRNIVNNSVHESCQADMCAWLDEDNILSLLAHQDSVSKDFMSMLGDKEYWFRGTFMVAERAQDGSFSHIIYGCQDITDAKLEDIQQQQLLDEARIQAEDANKAKSAFLFNMSHDIRTPMNAILGFTHLMENETDNKPLLLNHLAKLKSSGQYLLSLINDVLDMARIESGKTVIDEQVYHIDSPNNNAPQMFYESAREKGITLNATLDVQHTVVMADRMKLHQIVVNLLSNAVKYTPKGGTIDISLTEQPSDRPGYGKYVTRCSDTGIGMSQDFAEHIFEMFSRERNTTTSGVRGAGLGMSIVKRLVDLLGGTIEVETALGKGTTFTVTLWHKIVEDAPVPHHANPANSVSHTEISIEGMRVLLAEDNELNAEIAATILDSMGVEVDLAEDGAICVQKLCDAEAGRYDLILMDIQMPNMNGYEATMRIRSLEDKSKANIPIIAMTANAFEEDKKKAIEVGMNTHLSKPINIEKFKKTLYRYNHTKL